MSDDRIPLGHSYPIHTRLICDIKCGVDVLSLIVDTNVFIQCRPLQELSSSQWSSFEEVHLIVCRPVQQQIDNLKSRGNDRVGSRARRANSLFREIITGPDNFKLIRTTSPFVKLVLDPSLIPSPELSKRLDYSQVDDRLVGCLHAFCTKRPNSNARVLTHDTGPMATAQMLSLPFEPVPDEWLLPPEVTAAEREKNNLISEVERLRSKEPRFRIVCLNDSLNETDSLAFEVPRYDSLSDFEVSSHLKRIQSNFPIAQDFDQHVRAEYNRPGFAMIARGMTAYTPPSDEEIAAYTEHDYPRWLTNCESCLRELHTLLQAVAGQPGFHIVVENLGTRPGKDVRIDFSAKGNFQICPSQHDDEGGSQHSDSREAATGKFMLPLPPKPPRGKWTNRYNELISMVRSIGEIPSVESQFGTLAGQSVQPLRREPDAFYYVDGRPEQPCESFGLTCQVWRHNFESEHFNGEFFFGLESPNISGALECRIHAENLSDPLKQTVPLQIKVTRVSAEESAIALVDELIARASDANG